MQKIKEIVAQQQMKQLLQNFEDFDCNNKKRVLDPDKMSIQYFNDMKIKYSYIQ